MKSVYLCAATALALASTSASAADFIFDFTTDTNLFGPPVSGNGTFTTSDTSMVVNGQTAFSILSVTGMVNG